MKKMLSDEQKKELDNKVREIVIDVDELSSYEWDSNPYCVEPQLAGGSGCGVWNEDEELSVQAKTLIECIKVDGIWEYITMSDDDIEDEDLCEKLANEACQYLSKYITY